MAAEDRPRFDVGHYRTEMLIVVHNDRTEVRRPDMDEPLILKPGEQVRFGFAAGVTAEGYIEGVGWDAI